MERLTIRDLGALLGFLRRVYALQDLDGFRTGVAAALFELFPAGFAGYSEIFPALSSSGGDWSWPPGVYTPDTLLRWEQHMHQHPLLEHYLRTGDGHALRISDFLTRRQYRDLGLYSDLYRDMGVDDELALTFSVSDSLVIGLAVHRDRRNFTGRERLLMDLLGPHVRQAYDNARRVTRLKIDVRRLTQALESAPTALIALKPDGRIGSMTTRASQYLSHYFGVRGGTTQLPDDLRRWVANEQARSRSIHDAPPPAKSLLIERGGGRLHVRIVAGGDDLLLVLDEEIVSWPASLERLGLTPRETEVLRWVAEGKTNPEIGIILGASPRTIGKHLERIYAKLGVETRTAAAAVALNKAGLVHS